MLHHSPGLLEANSTRTALFLTSLSLFLSLYIFARFLFVFPPRYYYYHYHYESSVFFIIFFSARERAAQNIINVIYLFVHFIFFVSSLSLCYFNFYSISLAPFCHALNPIRVQLVLSSRNLI